MYFIKRGGLCIVFVDRNKCIVSGRGKDVFLYVFIGCVFLLFVCCVILVVVWYVVCVFLVDVFV